MIVLEQYMQNSFMYRIRGRFIVVVKATISRNHLLTIVFASVFMVSFGMISHNAFADTVMATIGVGVFPTGIDVNPNTNLIYVANFNYGTVSVINGSTNSVVNTITVY